MDVDDTGAAVADEAIRAFVDLVDADLSEVRLVSGFCRRECVAIWEVILWIQSAWGRGRYVAWYEKTYTETDIGQHLVGKLAVQAILDESSGGDIEVFGLNLHDVRDFGLMKKSVQEFCYFLRAFGLTYDHVHRDVFEVGM